MIEKIKWVFFGSSEFSVYVLEELKMLGLRPNLIVTTADKPQGRKLVMTPNVVKVWAKENGVETVEKLEEGEYDVFLVASYGRIIKKEIFDMPKRGTLNIHPSLLPKYRGPSPIISQILNDEKEIGVSIMQIDEGVDTGPVVAQRALPLLTKERSSEASGEVLSRIELERILAEEGTRLFAEILPEWLSGYLQPTPQEASLATITKKVEKEDGLLDLNAPARTNLLKVKAYEGWPGTYFFFDRRSSSKSEGGSDKMRIIVTDAKIEDNQFKILKVIPEGKKEMAYEDFLRGMKK